MLQQIDLVCWSLLDELSLEIASLLISARFLASNKAILVLWLSAVVQIIWGALPPWMKSGGPSPPCPPISPPLQTPANKINLL